MYTQRTADFDIESRFHAPGIPPIEALPVGVAFHLDSACLP